VGFPALFWLVAVIVAFDLFWPQPGRQWTGFMVSGAFGILAIIGVVAIVRHGNHIASECVFPLLMVSLSIGLAVASVREGKRKVRGATTSQLR